MPETNTTPTTAVPSNHKVVVHEESCRTVLVYTGYAISALLLLGAVAYHFSTQLLR